MRHPIVTVLRYTVIVLLSSMLLEAETPEVKSKLGDKVSSITEKRYKGTAWSGSGERSPIVQKTFHLKEYKKHYSSLGSVKVPTSFSEKVKRQTYRTPEVLVQERIPRKKSAWSGRLSRLSNTSRIKTDEQARLVSERKLYQAILQDTPQAYADIAEELSMKEINRFAFRKNRSKEVPEATAAAAGQGKAKQ